MSKDDFKAFIKCNLPEITCYKCPYNTNQQKCEYIIEFSEFWLQNIFNMIMNTDETSATKCFETINRIKRGDIDGDWKN